MTAGLRWSEDQLREHQKRRGNAISSPVAGRKSAPPPDDRMNKTERRYAQKLALERAHGEVTEFKFESVKLRLADLTFYTPDFLVMRRHQGITMEEVKGGFIRDDAMVKLKVAAEMYPMFVFRLCQWKGGRWTVKTI